MMQPPVLPAAPPPLLTPPQLQQLASARLAARKIRTAVKVATFDGWTIAIFAGLSFVCGLGGVTGPAMGVAMAIIAAVELKGAARLRRLEAPAARMLGFNQLVFALLLIAYALWSLYNEFHSGGVIGDLTKIDPAAAEMLKGFDVRGFARTIALLVYGSLIFVAITAQGGTALYYFSRVKHVRTYVEQTPAWIIQMQQTGVSL